MKKNLFLLPACFLLLGCPYFSEIPLSNKTHKISSHLLGNWVKCETNGKCTYINVSKKNEYESYFTYKETNSESEHWVYTTKTVSFTNVNGMKFLNIKNGDNDYLVSKYEIRNNKLYIYAMNLVAFIDKNQEMIKFEKSNDFYSFVDFKKGSKDFFLSPEIFSSSR